MSRVWLSVWMLVCVWLGSVQPAMALEMHTITTQFVGGEYQLSMTATIAAPLARVEAVLRDYEHYPKLDGRILEARVMTQENPDQVQLFTRIRVCFSFLCRNVERLERVTEHPGELLATVIPERSDAERGMTHTVLSAANDHTQVHYTTSIVPKFWVPALFGRNLMLHTLRDGTINLFKNVEKQAQQ